ncbi:MAG: hypothetical protein R2706_10380 [Acidimicrobiales bacterium]
MALCDESESTADERNAFASELETQLSETEAAFQELHESFATLTEQLERSRRAAAGKQLRISTIERQLQELSGQSRDLQGTLTTERNNRNRLEWLFLSFIAVMLIVMVLLAGYG